MQVDDNIRIPIRSFLERQSRERYRAFVIHGPPISGKTRFAQKLAKMIPGTIYLDMLHYIAERPELAIQVDRIDATRLFSLVVAYAAMTPAEILLVDHIDFLLHIWGDDLASFRYGLRSLTVTRTPAVIGFVLQTQRVFAEWNLSNCILSLDDIKAF